jgi:hypothetical protein
MRLTLASGYRPFDKQVAFHRSQKRFKVAAAGNRGGKTISGAAEFLWSIARDAADSSKGKSVAGRGRHRAPRLRYWVVTPTYKLGQEAFSELQRFIPYDVETGDTWMDGHPNGTDRTIWLHGDIQIEFRSASDPRTLVGASLNGIWVDEACRVKAEAWRGTLRARIADQVGWALFTTSPYGGRDNWVYTDLVGRVGIDQFVDAFNWTAEQNPYIPREEVRHARENLPTAWYNRDWNASWDSFGGAIYEELRDEIHVTTDDQLRMELGLGSRPLRTAFRKVVAAIDPGNSCGAMVTVGEIGDRNWVVVDEVYGPGIANLHGKQTWLSECQRVASEWGCREFIYDPADSFLPRDLRNNGVPGIRPAHKEIYPGIGRVAAALHVNETTKRPGLRILSHCKNLIHEMRVYRWKQARDGTSFLDEPAPGQADHACDALRYAAMNLQLHDYVEQSRSYSNAIPIG